RGWVDAHPPKAPEFVRRRARLEPMVRASPPKSRPKAPPSPFGGAKPRLSSEQADGAGHLGSTAGAEKGCPARPGGGKDTIGSFGSFPPLQAHWAGGASPEESRPRHRGIGTLRRLSHPPGRTSPDEWRPPAPRQAKNAPPSPPPPNDCNRARPTADHHRIA